MGFNSGGDLHLLMDVGPKVPGYWFYMVKVNNFTSDTFDEIVVFYKRLTLPGVAVWRNTTVLPRTSVVFPMGKLEQLESYVIGFFIGPDLVLQIPPSGNMTPAVANQRPGDVSNWLDERTVSDGES